jgi:hypothetical protein
MSAHRPTLEVPFEVAKFFKNRRKDVIVVSLSTYARLAYGAAYG